MIYTSLSSSFFQNVQESHLSVPDGFTDEEMTYLASGLANNCTLKRLCIRMCLNHNGPQGWGELASILRNPRSVLNHLDFAYSHSLNNDVLALVADSLRYNCMLKEMSLEWSSARAWQDWWDEWSDVEEIIQPRVTDWTPLSAVLCDVTSIKATFNSNHSLGRLTTSNEFSEWIEQQHLRLPPDLQKSLQLNRDLAPLEVARRKIINTHFSGNFNMEPFIDMDAKVLPQVMSWMAKDDYGKSILYEFIKNSSLFA